MSGSSTHGDSEERTMYVQDTVNAPATCESETQTRVCNDGNFGIWSGSYAHEACTVMGTLGNLPFDIVAKLMKV